MGGDPLRSDLAELSAKIGKLVDKQDFLAKASGR